MPQNASPAIYSEKNPPDLLERCLHIILAALIYRNLLITGDNNDLALLLLIARLNKSIADVVFNTNNDCRFILRLIPN